MSETQDSVLDFWNQRAGLGEWAGTNDVTAKRLEMETLAGFAQDGWRIVDVGCGNGITAMELARRFNADMTPEKLLSKLTNAPYEDSVRR